jgi:hypothetical protein
MSPQSQTDMERDKQAARLALVAAQAAQKAPCEAERAVLDITNKNKKKAAVKAVQKAQECAKAARRAADAAAGEAAKTRALASSTASAGSSNDEGPQRYWAGALGWQIRTVPDYWAGALGWQKAAKLNSRSAAEALIR